MTDLTLKAEQRSAMEAIYNHQDVFVWLPSDYGKSLAVFSSPAICHRLWSGTDAKT